MKRHWGRGYDHSSRSYSPSQASCSQRSRPRRLRWLSPLAHDVGRSAHAPEVHAPEVLAQDTECEELST